MTAAVLRHSNCGFLYKTECVRPAVKMLRMLFCIPSYGSFKIIELLISCHKWNSLSLRTRHSQERTAAVNRYYVQV